MTKSEMLAMGHHGCHSCAPKAWHTVPNLSGDFDLDATILHRTNTDLPHRLALYVRRTQAPVYHGYHGDE